VNGTWFLKSIVITVVVVVLQLELFSDLRLFGVMPELPLGLTVAAAWRGGPNRGAVIGFMAGLLYDLYLPTPLALNALAYCLVGSGVGVVAEVLAEGSERTVRQLLGTAAVTCGLVLFMTIGELLGEENLYNGEFPRILMVATLYTGALLPLLQLSMRWAMAESGPTSAGSFGLVK